jgi:hypothetical protein
VNRAVDPTLILWENLGYSKKSRYLYMLLTSLIALILICACIIINLYGRVADNEIQKFSPQVECSEV